MEQNENAVQITKGITKDPNTEAFTHAISFTEAIPAIKTNFWPNGYNLTANIS